MFNVNIQMYYRSIILYTIYVSKNVNKIPSKLKKYERDSCVLQTCDYDIINAYHICQKKMIFLLSSEICQD